MAVNNPGALVISLDFELHWGYRDRVPLNSNQRKKLLLARDLIPAVLDLFEEFRISATWATVGFLFAGSKEELERFHPVHKPTYCQKSLDPYQEQIGCNESEDPFHFAPSLIAEIARRPGQEIASHSFSHYYCLEEGQTAIQFEADLQSAVAIAAEKGYRITSYVFPRNQVNRQYLPGFQRAGISSYRATEQTRVKAPTCYKEQRRIASRLARLTDSYIDLDGPQTATWPRTDVIPACIAASRYLRPYTPVLGSIEDLRLHRIVTAIRYAARHGQIFHLWWHPEDFAWHRAQNLRFLRRVLSDFETCRRSYGMLSLSMRDAFQRQVNGVDAGRLQESTV